MPRRYSFKGRRYSLRFMHSRAGSDMFKTLSRGQQKNWAGFDSHRSRNKMRAQMRRK